MSLYSKLVNQPFRKKELAEIQRFWDKLYVSAAERQDVKEKFIKLRQSLAASWDKTDEELKEENMDREVMVGLSDTTAKFLKRIEEFEQTKALMSLFDNRVKVYRKKNSRQLIFEGNYVDAETKKNKLVSWVLPSGWPQTKPIVVRRYMRTLAKRGYILADSGRSSIKFLGVGRRQIRLKLKRQTIALLVEYLSENRVKLKRI